MILNCVFQLVIERQILILANAKKNDLIYKLLNDIVEHIKISIASAFSIKLLSSLLTRSR